MIPQQEYTLNVHLNKYTDNCEKNWAELTDSSCLFTMSIVSHRTSSANRVSKSRRCRWYRLSCSASICEMVVSSNTSATIIRHAFYATFQPCVTGKIWHILEFLSRSERGEAVALKRLFSKSNQGRFRRLETKVIHLTFEIKPWFNGAGGRERVSLPLIAGIQKLATN